MNFANSFSCTRPGFSHQFFHKLNSQLQRRSSSRLQIQAQRLRVQIPTKCVQEDTSDKQIEDIQSSQLEKDQVSLLNGVQASAVSADNKDDELSTLLKDKNAQKKKQRRRQADSTDWVASALTRRFGIVGGLAWLGILAVGTIGEQVKTRLEYAQEQAGTKQVEDAPFIETYSGLSYRDIKIGGGQYPRKGDLAVINLRIELSDGQVVEDTFARGKPIVLYFGGRPFTGGICEGVEEVLLDMKAGGIREVIVPPELGFSERGAVLRPTEHVPEKQGIIPPDAKLFYKVELVRVSIPPS